jgi:phosphohistidine phosphatase
MDLLLWRHAEAWDAEAGQDDLDRELTPRGAKQAQRVARWLDRQLSDNTRIWVSPARRAVQTAEALDRRYKLAPELGPAATVEALLQRVQWPQARQAALVVGHQPVLGQTLAQLLQIESGHCVIRKGGLWWLRARVREGQWSTVVMAVQAADNL